MQQVLIYILGKQFLRAPKWRGETGKQAIRAADARKIEFLEVLIKP